MRLKILAFLLCITAVFSLSAAGQKDLSKKVPGYGILVVGNEGRLTTPFHWVYNMVFTNSSDNKEYTIEKIPAISSKIKFFYLPPGDYHITRIIQKHFDGSEFIPDQNIPLGVYHEINLSFTISEGAITLFPYYLYKFNNKRDLTQTRETDGNNYDPPGDFIKNYGKYGHHYYWDFNDTVLQYIFYLVITKNIERTILTNLVKIKGAGQWLYKPRFPVNNVLWLNVPKKPIPVKKVVKVQPWILPKLPPRGNLYLLSIGIDTYRNKNLSLTGAGEAAKEFASLAVRLGKDKYNRTISETIQQTEVTKKTLLTKLAEISEKVSKVDTFVVFLASHGISDITGRPYIFPSDGSIGAIPESCLSYQDFLSAIKSKGLVLLVMDTGRSGQWMDSNKAYFSLDPVRIKETVEKTPGIIGMYSITTGQFINSSNPDITALLKKVLPDGTLLLDPDLWRVKVQKINRKGLWTAAGRYRKYMNKQQESNITRQEILANLAHTVNIKEKEKALSIVESVQTGEYLFPSERDILKKSIISYFADVSN